MAISVTSAPLTGAGLLTAGCGDQWFSSVEIPGLPGMDEPGRGGGQDDSGGPDWGESNTPGEGPAGRPGDYSHGGVEGGSGGGGGGGGEPGSIGGSGGSGYGGGGGGGPIPTDPSIGNIAVGDPITREQILARARFWAAMGVPYSMAAYTNDPQGKSYRTDCSGLVSMALKLETSLSTVTLPSQVVPISKADLLPGDIVGNLGGGTAGAAGHVMIFARWADSSMTTFFTVEETPPKAVERTRVWGSAPFASHAWRYRNLIG